MHSNHTSRNDFPVKAVGYVRCSTDMQAETSPDQQKTLIQEWALKNRYQIVDWFIDIGKSGTSFERRPAFVQLRSKVESKPDFRAVIALDESRWGRAGASDSIYYKAHFKKTANVDVVLVRTIANTGNTGFDTVLEAFEGHLSQEESRKKSERTYDGCVSAILQGHSAGGTAPYGYQRVAVNRFTNQRRMLKPIIDDNGVPIVNSKGLLIHEQIRPKEEYSVWDLGNPEEIAVVRRIFNMKAEHRYGYARIAKALNADGVACPQRGKWGNKNQLWAAATIGAILRNPAYKGARAYNRLKKRGIGKYAPRYWVQDQSQWTIVEHAIPPIVTETEWELANKPHFHSVSGRLSKVRFESPFLLSGLIVCTKCGFHFHGKSQVVGPPGKRSRKMTYQDSGYSSKGACMFTTIDANTLESAVLLEIRKSFLASEDFMNKVERALEQLIVHNETEDKHPHAEEELRVIKQKINMYLKLAEQGAVVDEIAPKLRQLDAQRRTLEQSIQKRISAHQPIVDRQQITEAVEKFFSNFEEKFEQAPIWERKSLIGRVVERIEVNPERRVAKCFLRTIPKGIGQAEPVTPIMKVPPTRFELVLQA